MSQANSQPARWSNVAPFWEKHRGTLECLFRPVSEALIEEAEVVPGMSVLDIATGHGEPALSIAEWLGPDGEVVGVDPADGMIEAARGEAARRSLGNARFEVGAADRLPFSDNRFDAVVCRFGVMFFPSPAPCAREMLRVLKPGRMLTFAVWHFPENNPFHSGLSRLVDSVVPPQPLPPDAPEAFRFAAPGKLKRVLEEAGAAHPTERVFPFSIKAAMSVEEFWSLRLEMSGILRDRLATLSPERFAEVKEKALECFRQFTADGGLSFPAEVLLVSARK
jgi:ubiquinone/menaquinone biosynthesis C-methylase UbiE